MKKERTMKRDKPVNHVNYEYTTKKRDSRSVNLMVISGLLIVSLLLGSFLLLLGNSKAGPVANTITMYDSTNPGENLIEVGPELLDWVITDHGGFDNAYTFGPNPPFTNNNPSPRELLAYAYRLGTSGFYNGFVTDKHVVLDGKIVRFLGYQAGATGGTTNPQMDRFFTNDYPDGFDTLSFTMRPSNLNYHTFSETAFLFNGRFSGTEPALTYTGYMILLKNASSAVGSTAELQLVYASNVSMNTNNYPVHTITTTAIPATPANNTWYRIGLPYKSGIANGDNTPFAIKVEREPSGAFRVYFDGELKADIDAPLNMNDPLYNGFGFFNSYLSGHNCPILTVVQYDDVVFRGRFLNEKSTVRVQFREYGTNLETADDQVKQDWVGTYYRVDPLDVIVDNGITYRFMYADPPDLDPLTLKRGETVIILYYERRSAIAEKDAAVNGVSERGLPVSPVHVNSSPGSGNYIDYSIPIENDGSAATLSTPPPSSTSSRYSFDQRQTSPTPTNAGDRWNAGTNPGTATLTAPSNPAGYQSRYNLNFTAQPGTRTGVFCQTVTAELPNIPAGKYQVLADFGVGVQQSVSPRIGRVSVNGMVTAGTAPAPAAPHATGGHSTWSSELVVSPHAAVTTPQNFMYSDQIVAGFFDNSTAGSLYLSLSLFVDVTTNLTANNRITSDLTLYGITLVPLNNAYSFTDLMAATPPIMPITNAADRWLPTTNPGTSALTAPANPNAYQSHYEVRAGTAAPNPAAGNFQNMVLAELPNVLAGTYTVMADFSVGMQQNAASRVSRVSLNAVTATSQPIALPEHLSTTGPSKAWGTELVASCPFTYNSTAAQTLHYPGQAVGTVSLSAPGSAYLLLAAFHECTGVAANNTIFSDIYLRGIYLVPTNTSTYTYAHALSGAGGLTQATNHVATGITGTQSNPHNGSTPGSPHYQSRYILANGGTTANTGSELFSNVVNAVLPNVPAGEYQILADFSVGMQQSVASRINALSVRGMVTTNGALPPIPPATPPAPGTASTWGDELMSSCPIPLNVTTAQLMNFPNYPVGTLSVGAAGPAYVSLGIFGNGQAANWTANNTVTTDFYLRGITLVPVTTTASSGTTYTFDGALVGNLSNRGNHALNTPPITANLTTPANTTAYQSRYALNNTTNTNTGNEAFSNVVNAKLTGVAPGSYKVVLDYSVGLNQSVINRVTASSVRYMLTTDGNLPPIAPNPAPAPGTGSGWGSTLVSSCPFNYGTGSNNVPQLLNYPDQGIGIVTVDASGDVYVSLGLFGDCSTGNWATGNTVTTDVLLRCITLIPFETDRFTLLDPLPRGLAYIPGSAYCTDDAGLPVNIDLYPGFPTVSTDSVTGLTTLCWEFGTLPAGTTVFHFKVQALTPALAETDYMYINNAKFFDARNNTLESTNSTYHTNRNIVSEMFRSFYEPSDQLKTAINTPYDPGTSYAPNWSCYGDIIRRRGTTEEFRTWRYVGYTLDFIASDISQVERGQPEEDVWFQPGQLTPDKSNGWNLIDSDHVLHFYFVEDVQVTVRYVSIDDPNTELKPPVSMLLPALVDFDLALSHMRPIGNWAYRGYVMDDDIYAPGAYVEGAYPRNFTYIKDEMNVDHEIVLFFEEEFDYLPPLKNVFINDDLTHSNGEEDYPALVSPGDALNYCIDVYNSHIPFKPNADPMFDFVFVLDWSASMGGSANNPSPGSGVGRMNDTSTANWMQARAYGAKLIQELCAGTGGIFDQYPGSRVSVLCANASQSNYNNSGYTFLQLDTPFVDGTGFDIAFQNAFLNLAAPTYGFDDSAQFLAAAIDKLSGETAVRYGADLNNSSRVKQVIPRPDFSRIPVIVMISDFQMTEATSGPGANNNSGVPYWSEAMKAQADRFSSIFRFGQLMTIRLDHDQPDQINTYSDAFYDNLMTSFVAPAGHKGWASINFGYDTLFPNASSQALTMISDRLPVPGPLKVFDTVPEGLILDETSISHGGVYDSLTRTITWDLSLEPKGMIHLSFSAAVSETEEYENTAHILWPNGDEDDTNTTYNAYYILEKNAYINGSVTAENGAEDNLAVIKRDALIHYTIDLFNSHKPHPPSTAYDIVFALDWSASMNLPNSMDDSKTGGPTTARDYCRDIILELSEDVLTRYPESRVSVMGMNCDMAHNNCNDEDYVFLQVDTPFVDIGGYDFTIKNAYTNPPVFWQDDNAQFLRAAVDKLAGVTTTYGNGLSTPGGPKAVNARLATEMDRIPVIILLSDFQMTEAASAFHNNSGVPYWSSAMKTQADRFAATFPKGILMTVRMDHNQNADFSSASVYDDYDALMENNVAPAGHDSWAFVAVPDNQLYSQTLQELTELFDEKAPPIGPLIVTDVVAEGLEVDESSISHGGTYDAGTRTITWDLSEEPRGRIQLSFDAYPRAAGCFENTAHIQRPLGTEEDTNTTYHVVEKLILHIRQLVVNPRASVQQPEMGYYLLSNDGDSLPVTSRSGVLGGTTGFTMCFVDPSGNDIFNVYDIIPQYYAFAGSFQNNGAGPLSGHDDVTKASIVPPTTVPNGSIALDYDNRVIDENGEWWLTVYITPERNPTQYSWGYATNDFGTVYPTEPDEPPGGDQTWQVEAGGYSMLALAGNGDVYAWGFNGNGELGNPIHEGIGGCHDWTSPWPHPKNPVPLKVVGLMENLQPDDKVIGIDASDCASYAWTQNGEVWAWGQDIGGRLGNPAVIDYYTYVPTKVADLSSQLKPGDKIAYISAGWSHVLAVTEQNDVFAWGQNDFGELGVSYAITESAVPIKITNRFPAGVVITDVYAGYEVSVALASNGDVYTWGNDDFATLGRTIIGIDSNLPGKVNLSGLIDPGDSIAYVSPGLTHVLLLTEKGDIISWGLNLSGQLGYPRDPGGANRKLPAKTSCVEPLLQPGDKVISVKAADLVSFALTQKGDVFSWGDNYHLILGYDVPDPDVLPPRKIDFSHLQRPGDKIIAISVGFNFDGSANCAVTQKGDVFGWGLNFHGMLGNNPSPTLPVKLTMPAY